jgi:uncharacterized membrane-anchored protein
LFPRVAALLILLLPSVVQAKAGETESDAPDPASIKWTDGPAKVSIGQMATLNLPDGYVYTDGPGTQALLRLMHNPTNGSELGMLADRERSWFVLFEFESIGYVKDADKEKLDAGEILSSIRQSNEASNEARRENGWPPISIVGWHTPPFYNPQTNNLEWCIQGESQGHSIINYNTRILGRGGVMSANLLVDPTDLTKVLPIAKQLLDGYSYAPGKRYAEFRNGDKVAQFGLAALVVGGAAGVAAKAGLLAKLGPLLAKFWKFLILGLAAVGGLLKKLLTGRKQQIPPSPAPGDPPVTP